MFESDSYFVLPLWAAAGLAIVSAVFAFLTLYSANHVHRRCPKWSTGIAIALHSALALLVFWLFIWLSPQGYYAYYIAIIESLIWHNVIDWPPAPSDLILLVTFTGARTLAEISQGILAWLLIVQAFYFAMRKNSPAGKTKAGS